MKKGGVGQESPADPEKTQEDPSDDERETEVVEPYQEPDPSARDEFNRVYTEKLQVVDEAVEEYARALDSVSYPVSVRMPLSATKPSHQLVSVRPYYLRPSSSFSSIANPNPAQRVRPCTGLT